MDGCLHVTMNDGSIHTMPWAVIRFSYMLCHVSGESEPTPEPSINDLKHWFSNCMTWEEVSSHLKVVKKVEPDYREAFDDREFTLPVGK